MDFYEHKIVQVEDLIPYALNSRTHSDEQVAQLAASIREFGFTNPILIDQDSNIIAGHGRLLAARKSKMAQVPAVVVTGLDDRKRRALVIADNKLALNAGWDEEALRVDLEDLAGDFGKLMGFSEDELVDLLRGDEATEGLTDEDAVPDAPEVPVTVEGDVWLLGRHRLMCGDSTSIDAVERLMGGVKADMVFTDPPYGVDYKGINNDDRGGLEELLRSSFANYLASSKNGASIYVFHSDKCADIFHVVFREFFHFSSIIVWAKNSLTLSRTDYQSQHEPCLYGWMNNGSHTFHGDRKQTSLWKFDKERVDGHTTPKPVALIERALSNSSKGGDVISDLFGGSGSTLIACEKNHRDCRMMELDPKYCDVIIKRWQEFTGEKATHEESGKTYEELSA